MNDSARVTAILPANGPRGKCSWTLLAIAGLFASHVGGSAIAQEAWSLGPATTRIGEGQTPEHELDRVTSLLVRGERLYVADRSQKIRAYDLATGAVVAIGGGSGRGPGEFRALDWIDDCTGDQLLASDGIEDRISVFTLALEHIRTFRLGPKYGSCRYGALDLMRWSVCIEANRRRSRESVLVPTGWPLHSPFSPQPMAHY